MIGQKNLKNYGLKKIEESNLLDKVNLKKPDCEFSHLLKLANENKDEELAELLLNKTLVAISKSGIKELLLKLDFIQEELHA